MQVIGEADLYSDEKKPGSQSKQTLGRQLMDLAHRVLRSKEVKI